MNERVSDQAGHDLTPRWVQDKLVEAFSPQSRIRLSQPVYDKLASCLISCRAIFDFEKRAIPYAEKAREVEGACTVIETRLPVILQNAQLPNPSASVRLQTATDRAVAALEGLLSAVAKARRDVFVLRGPEARSLLTGYHDATRAGARWHTFAEPIFDQMVDALRPLNPSMQLGRGDNGPATKFITAVIPHLTGEAPTPAAVGKELRRVKIGSGGQLPSQGR